ncbi:SIS domain-containing protein [uncultured Sneathia sp.]|uniref:SIS domain-containing protein n=1 Tax=uncultured Sneathia sp. TaxID=278067 RepID=UPI0025970B03|nr:SIS domain-containing protein [uncultured Sneathia sp.]
MLKFNEEKQIESVKGALKLRSDINKIVDNACEKGYDNICFIGIGGTWASSMQAFEHMKEYSSIEVIVENAAEYLAAPNKRITDKTIVIFSSVTGSTEELVKAIKRIKEIGSNIIGFIDNENTQLHKLCSSVITYKANEQLKFFMIADRFMYNNNEFNEYEELYENLENYLPQVLVDVEKEADEFAKEFAKKHCNDPIHYFIGSGNQWGATYSYAMCYWEEQLWIKTKSIRSSEFFHGMFEIVTKETPVTVFIGEDNHRYLSERVAKFLPRICENYTIIDTKNYELKGIKEKFRKHISHLVMHGVTNRIDAYMERETRHPMEIRRYYRRLDY